MKIHPKASLRWALSLSLLCSAWPLSAWSFDSGSSGADGAFTPLVDTELALPADGVFHYTEVDIPEGVQVRFARNAQNTPVTWLVSGDVRIAGEILLSGSDAAAIGAGGDGNVGDDGLPGRAGPGGYDGGEGGVSSANPEEARGGNGLGPGGGAGHVSNRDGRVCGGVGGSYAQAGGVPVFYCDSPQARPAYGNAQLLPLVGGSGGSGGAGGLAFSGSGGGGGGGALLIAASGTLTVSGSLRADGGRSGASAGSGAGAPGGGGSGGSIRLVATTLSGNGTLSALGGAQVFQSGNVSSGEQGSVGRIRLEAETFQRTQASTPAYSFAAPGEVFLAGLPSLRISTVAGSPAPAVPTGNADVLLPEDSESVSVGFATRNVPLGNVVRLRVVPGTGVSVEAVSGALSGTLESASASVQVNVPLGHSVLQASVSYTVSVEQGQALAPWAEGEQVVQVELRAGPAGTEVWLESASGQRYHYPSGFGGSVSAALAGSGV